VHRDYLICWQSILTHGLPFLLTVWGYNGNARVGAENSIAKYADCLCMTVLYLPNFNVLLTQMEASWLL
jgi:hypothetical protein